MNWVVALLAVNAGFVLGAWWMSGSDEQPAVDADHTPPEAPARQGLRGRPTELLPARASREPVRRAAPRPAPCAAKPWRKVPYARVR